MPCQGGQNGEWSTGITKKLNEGEMAFRKDDGPTSVDIFGPDNQCCEWIKDSMCSMSVFEAASSLILILLLCHKWNMTENPISSAGRSARTTSFPPINSLMIETPNNSCHWWGESVSHTQAMALPAWKPVTRVGLTRNGSTWAVKHCWVELGANAVSILGWWPCS